jgi:hypothetical protein
MQDKKSLSIAMLVEGRPQAFVDFFQLTHSTLLHEQPTAGAAATAAKPAAPAGKQGSPAKTGVTAAAPPGAMDLPQESLLLLKTQLVKADSARRWVGALHGAASVWYKAGLHHTSPVCALSCSKDST